MLAVFLSAFVLISVAMLAIGVGLLFGRRGPQGSCGGLGALGMQSQCDMCAERDRCRELDETLAGEER